MTGHSGPLAHRLTPPVQGGRDHCLGSDAADLTLLEYGSFDCPYCQGAHEVVSNLRDRFGERLRYVFRHRPITGDERALRAAELAEYADQTAGRFWEAHDALMQGGAALVDRDLDEVAGRLGLDRGDEQAWSRARQRVREDRESARRHGVT